MTKIPAIVQKAPVLTIDIGMRTVPNCVLRTALLTPTAIKLVVFPMAHVPMDVSQPSMDRNALKSAVYNARINCALIPRITASMAAQMDFLISQHAPVHAAHGVKTPESVTL